MNYTAATASTPAVVDFVAEQQLAALLALHFASEQVTSCVAAVVHFEWTWLR